MHELAAAIDRWYLAEQYLLVVDGDQARVRKIVLQHCESLKRRPVLVREKQDHRLDIVLSCFHCEADLLADLEEIIEGGEAEVDDLVDAIIDDDSIHQRHG